MKKISKIQSLKREVRSMREDSTRLGLNCSLDTIAMLAGSLFAVGCPVYCGIVSSIPGPFPTKCR